MLVGCSQVHAERNKYGILPATDNFLKTANFLLVSLVALAGCPTAQPSGNSKPEPETVLITYHAKPGSEAELQATLLRAWQIYRTEHLVQAEPHTLVRDAEDGNRTRFVEIFTWVSHAIPEHAPDAVQKIWQQEQALCEARNGHSGIEGGEVTLVSKG